jgi:Tfp pilus assembly protein FimV
VHVVEPGESLWSVAVDALAARGIDDPVVVDRYWRALCDLNRDRLASGDPDRVMPGEGLDLPPVA